MPTDIQMANRKYMDILTKGVLSSREITRLNVQHGHEDDSLLTFFPNGFICHDADRTPLADKHNAIKENGCMYRVQVHLSEKPKAI